ncbi:MAG: hypothetical protein R2692_05630 [Microbacterium sp.]
MRSRVEGIILHVVDAYGLRLRLPVARAAQLLVDVSGRHVRHDRGRSSEEITERMNDRLERLVGVLVENPRVVG